MELACLRVEDTGQKMESEQEEDDSVLERGGNEGWGLELLSNSEMEFPSHS